MPATDTGLHRVRRACAVSCETGPGLDTPRGLFCCDAGPGIGCPRACWLAPLAPETAEAPSIPALTETAEGTAWGYCSACRKGVATEPLALPRIAPPCLSG